MYFAESLDRTTELFLKTKYVNHTTETINGVIIRFSKVNKKQELINRICRKLEKKINEHFIDTNEIYALGFNDVTLIVCKTKKDYDQDQINNENVECAISEEINKKEFEKLEKGL